MALELEAFMYAANRIGKPEELEGWYAYCVGVDDGLLYQPLSKLGTGDEKHGLEFVPDKNQLSVLPDALKKVGWGRRRNDCLCRPATVPCRRRGTEKPLVPGIFREAIKQRIRLHRRT